MDRSAVTGSRSVTATEAARAALDAQRGGPAVAVVTAAGGVAAGRRMLVYDDRSTGTLGDAALDDAARGLGRDALAGGAPATRDAATADGPVLLYAEPHRRAVRLFIVGAGHIAVPLAELGVLLDLDVVVLDDREDFATTDRFPPAAAVRRVDFEDPFHDDAPAPEDLVVLVTRAHRYDFDCLSRLLASGSPPRYIGMVGSRRRVRAAFGALLDAGVPRARLAAVHAPIGVDIGAETPAEIAVSIAAELVAVLRGHAAGGSLRDAEAVIGRLL